MLPPECRKPIVLTALTFAGVVLDRTGSRGDHRLRPTPQLFLPDRSVRPGVRSQRRHPDVHPAGRRHTRQLDQHVLSSRLRGREGDGDALSVCSPGISARYSLVAPVSWRAGPPRTAIAARGHSAPACPPPPCSTSIRTGALRADRTGDLDPVAAPRPPGRLRFDRCPPPGGQVRRLFVMAHLPSLKTAATRHNSHSPR